MTNIKPYSTSTQSSDSSAPKGSYDSFIVAKPNDSDMINRAMIVPCMVRKLIFRHWMRRNLFLVTR